MHSGNVWLVEHPLFQYKEDVVKLANANNLVIIDSKYKDTLGKSLVAKDTPKLTRRKK